MEPKVVIFKERIQRAIKAFKGQNVGSLQFGIDVKRCNECEHRSNDIRDNLLVTAGCRAGLMSELQHIVLPDGLSGEDELAAILAKAVDFYMVFDVGQPFDLYIEDVIIKEFANLEE